MLNGNNLSKLQNLHADLLADIDAAAKAKRAEIRRSNSAAKAAQTRKARKTTAEIRKAFAA